MLDYKDLLAELHAVAAHLKDEGHVLADKLLGIYHGLMGEAKTDAEQVAHDAETAAAPVVAEAEHDAAKVAEHAVTHAEAAAEAPAAEPKA